MTVAYPGEEGAYAAEAGARLYPDAELVSLKSWADVVRAVGKGDAGYGVLPIENSLAGPIPETYDLLLDNPPEPEIGRRIEELRLRSAAYLDQAIGGTAAAHPRRAARPAPEMIPAQQAA